MGLESEMQMQLPELKSMDKPALFMYKLLAASTENNWYYEKVNYMEKYYKFVWLHCKQGILYVWVSHGAPRPLDTMALEKSQFILGEKMVV